MKRSPIKRSTKPMKRTRMNQRSAKGKAAHDEWMAEKREHLSRQPVCQHYIAGIPLEKCWGPIDVHHINPRGAGGRVGPAGELITLCRAAHQYVEEHRRWAKEQGLLK